MVNTIQRVFCRKKEENTPLPRWDEERHDISPRGRKKQHAEHINLTKRTVQFCSVINLLNKLQKADDQYDAATPDMAVKGREVPTRLNRLLLKL